jgi:hypothetical protein
MNTKTSKRKKLTNLTGRRTLRMNAWGETALEQASDFFANTVGQKLSSAIIFCLALGDYRNHITSRMHDINQLSREAYQEALDDFKREELQKVRFLRDRDDM